MMIASIGNPVAGVADPFFSLTSDSEWNACIGRQGAEENYVDGYMEAAIELANAVIDQGQYGKRDTLAMPILYNARHGVELSLKFTIDRLCEAGVIAKPHPKNHDIQSHWALIDTAPLGDATLRRHVSALEPFITSLHGIDEDGQQLRYAETQAGQKSLEDKALCNLKLIRENLLRLNETLVAMKYRAIDLIRERATGTFTADCSRRDLLAIAKMLPARDQWSSAAFDASKAEVRKHYGLSGQKFSRAVDIIKDHREMGSQVGFEFTLAHLTDANARFVIEEWSKAHPPRLAGDDEDFDYPNRDWAAFREGMRIQAAAESAVLAKLSPEEIADLEAIFYIGRERLFCEDYDKRLRLTLNEHRASGNLSIEVNHMITKTNLLNAMARGISILGRPRLAAALRAMRPDLPIA